MMELDRPGEAGLRPTQRSAVFAMIFPKFILEIMAPRVVKYMRVLNRNSGNRAENARLRLAVHLPQEHVEIKTGVGPRGR